MGLTKGPSIHYRQPENEQVCLVASFASFLHSVDCHQHAAQLFSVKHKIQENISIWKHFGEYLDGLSCFLKLQRYDRPFFGNTNQILLSLPIVTCLVDSYGQEDHCIIIYNNWIFDGNFCHALPLKKESLDICYLSNKKK